MTDYLQAESDWDTAKNALDAQVLVVRSIANEMDNFYDKNFLALSEVEPGMTDSKKKSTVKMMPEYLELKELHLSARKKAHELKVKERAARHQYNVEKTEYFNNLRIDQTSGFTRDIRPITK